MLLKKNYLIFEFLKDTIIEKHSNITITLKLSKQSQILFLRRILVGRTRKEKNIPSAHGSK